MKNPRAYYIGAFAIGCGAPRVELIARLPDGRYLVRVTSPRAYAFTRGERLTCSDHDLYDKKRAIPGPRLRGVGQEWKKSAEALPLMMELRNYNTGRICYVNA